MDAFPASPGVELTWVKSEHPRHSYALKDGIREFAKVTWSRAPINRAEGEWANGYVFVERIGTLISTVEITDGATRRKVAQMPWSWTGRRTRLGFMDGHYYLMTKAGFRNNRWTFSRDGEEVMELRPQGVMRTSGKVRMKDVETVKDHIPVLTILLWYSHIIRSFKE